MRVGSLPISQTLPKPYTLNSKPLGRPTHEYLRNTTGMLGGLDDHPAT